MLHNGLNFKNDNDSFIENFNKRFNKEWVLIKYKQWLKQQ